MKIAICYYSRHHGNTLRVLEAMTQGLDVDLIDVTSRMAVRLDYYDVIGFASGIYHSQFHETVTGFLRQYLPEDKKVFFVYTCGAKRRGCTDEIRRAAHEKHAAILGEYGCRGFDTYGPFRFIGGIAKGHPSARELQEARSFFTARICQG